MIAAEEMILAPITELQLIHGVRFPRHAKFRQFLITGPPGAGKSTLVSKMRGWPYEAYVDLSAPHWWRMQALTFRPRELHLGLPFKGYREALTVVDTDWLENQNSLQIDFSRIEIPPAKSFALGVDWRSRYTFEFILPPAEEIYRDRLKRAKTGLFPHDQGITLESVKAQIDFYRTIAWYFWLNGMSVYVRTEREGPPLQIMECRRAPPPQVEKKPTLLDRGRDLINLARDGKIISPGLEPERITGAHRILWGGQPFQLTLGDKVLEFHPDRPFSGGEGDGDREWIIHTGSKFYEGVPRFLRLRSGKSVILGHTNTTQNNIFGFDSSVAERHVRVSNRRGHLTILPLDPEFPTNVSAPAIPRAVWVARHENLVRLPDVLGRPLTNYADDEALDVIRDVNKIIGAEAYRELNDDGAPGGIIKFPDDMTVVILGDTHTRIDNILRLLTEGGLLAALEANKACLVFLGDLVHSEEEKETEDMETSIFILDFFCMLKRRFPENVFYLRGNHESFSDDLGKSGVPQGLLLRKHLKKRRGKEYTDEIGKLFEALAFIVQGKGFAACHGAPVRTRVDRSTLVNISRYPGIQYEIVWNRLRQSNRPAGYGKGSVKRFRRTLGLPKKSPIIVGHTPLSLIDTVWMNVGGIKGHHVVYSAYTHRFGAMVLQNGQATPLEFVPEPALAYLNITNDVRSSVLADEDHVQDEVEQSR